MIFLNRLNKTEEWSEERRAMVMDKKLLRAKMIAFGDTSETLATFLGINKSSLSAKMNCYRGANFTQKEISAIIGKYNLTAEDISSIFFASIPS